MRRCPNGHEVADNVKFCPTCGAEIISGNKFCTKCGSERKGTEKFCSHCGIPFDCELANERIIDNEEKKNSFKKYLPYIIGAVVLLGIIGYSSSKDSSNNKDNSLAVDSVSVNTITNGENTDNTIAREALYAILSKTIGVVDDMSYPDYVRLYYSKEYKDNYNQACKKAERESCEYPRLWWQYSDSDPERFNINEVKMISSNEAKASVDISSELYIGKYEIRLIEENGKWVIGKVNEISVHGNPDFNKSEESNEESYNEYHSNNNSYSSSNTSLSRTFANEQYVTMYLANQKFKDNGGLTILFDGNLRMYIDGDYAGVVSVLRYNSTSALLRYGGGQYGEGKISVKIVNDKLQLTDPTDGTVYYQR